MKNTTNFRLNFSQKRTILLALLFALFLPFTTVAQNSEEDAQLSEILELLDKGESIVGKRIDLRDINFETGKNELPLDAKQYLGNVVEFLSNVPTINLTLSGHTDNVGNPADNLRLSQDRASAVKAFFIEKGVSSDRLTSQGFGSERPIGDNKTEDGRRYNRRVEIEVYSLIENVVQAQDVIYLTNGQMIGVAYWKALKDSIEYQNFSSKAIHYVPLSQVDLVKYADGSQKKFPKRDAKPKHAKVNPNAAPSPSSYLLKEFGFWLEYMRAPTVRSKNFADLELIDETSDGRVRLPLANQQFKEGTHGTNIGVLVGITEKAGVLGEWQYSASEHLLVRSWMLGGTYDLFFSEGVCLAAVSKLGLTTKWANLGTVQSAPGFSSVTINGTQVRSGDYINATTNKLNYQIGFRGDFQIRREAVRLHIQLGVGGNLFGTTRFRIDSDDDNSSVKLKFKDNGIVESGSSKLISSRPSLRSMGVYFSIGYGGFLGSKRKGFY